MVKDDHAPNLATNTTQKKFLRYKNVFLIQYFKTEKTIVATDEVYWFQHKFHFFETCHIIY